MAYLPLIKSTGPITISNAQIKALNTSPLTILAAPAAGYYNLVTQTIVKFTYGGTNVFVTGGNLQLRYTNGSGSIISAVTDTFYIASSSSLVYTIGNLASPYMPLSSEIIVLYTPSSNPSGNAANDNTMTIELFYEVRKY